MEINQNISEDLNYLYNLKPENNDGNIEYKYKLVNLDNLTFNKRITQMKFRIIEGGGEAFYYIGIMDDGTPLGLTKLEYDESVQNLNLIALEINCIITKISEQISNINNSKSYIGEFLIRESDDNNYIDLKIAVAGNVDAGKSTTIGTLTKGILDDGRGRSRLHVFNFKHEIETGRTSSIGHQIMGYDLNGDIVNTKYDRLPTWAEIVSNSNKIITFFDMAGHEKYLRTTIYGLTSISPDYCLIMIGANTGPNHITKEHIGICITLKIPFIIIVSKIDIVPANILEENMKKINNICKNGAYKIPYLVKTHSDISTIIKNIKSNSIIPILQISNVTSYNLDLLKVMLNLLPIRNNYSSFQNLSIEFLIDHTYTVIGHSCIVSGILKCGIIRINDILAIGPYHDGSYKQTKIKSIQNKFKDVKEAKAGSYICISLKNITRKEIKKGMVLVSNISNCKIAQYEFWAFIHILHSPTTIKVGYQPFVHIDQVRQSVEILTITKLDDITNQTNSTNYHTVCNLYSENNNETKIIENNKKKLRINKIDYLETKKAKQKLNIDTNILIADDNILRTGDKAYIKLQFISKPEYIKPMMKLIFREGKVKAIGKVI